MKAIVMHSWKFTHFFISSNRFFRHICPVLNQIVPCRTFFKIHILKTSIYKKYKRNMLKYLFLCVGREFQKDLW